MVFAAIKIFRLTLAFAVALWMAGAGCLMGCENAVMAAPRSTEAVTLVASGDACASARSADCCAKHKSSGSKHRAAPAKTTKSSVNAFVPGLRATPSPSMADCPLAVNASAALSKAGPDQSNASLPLTRAHYALTVLDEQIHALSSPLRLPNRGHTYLRCCVFLI